MDLPIELKSAIEANSLSISQNKLIEHSQDLIHRYKNKSGSSKSLLTQDAEAVAYSLFRMPATFGAVAKSIEQSLQIADLDVASIIDYGAGTGAATWAVSQFFDLEKITCFEREPAMMKLGQSLMKNTSLANLVEWKSFDLLKDSVVQKADLVMASYVLNELSDNDRKIALEKILQSAIKVVAIIEPGTPVGYSQILQTRQYLIDNGWYILAPCPHQSDCKLAKEDWCHATCRVQRSKTHKAIKSASVPYEDEKFSYIIATKEDLGRAKNRILRHPIINTGRVELRLCSATEVKDVVISKKDKELFKKARKSDCGDDI